MNIRLRELAYAARGSKMEVHKTKSSPISRVRNQVVKVREFAIVFPFILSRPGREKNKINKFSETLTYKFRTQPLTWVI